MAIVDSGSDKGLTGGPVLSVAEMARLDTTPWYKKKNLRLLYFIIFPTCIGVEMTSGYV